MSYIESLSVLLRDVSTSPCKIIIEVEKEIDWDNHEDEEEDDDTTFAESVLKEFCKKVSELETIPEHTDVFIGWYAGQGNIEFPEEFFKLVHEKKLKVELCLND